MQRYKLTRLRATLEFSKSMLYDPVTEGTYTTVRACLTITGEMNAI